MARTIPIKATEGYRLFVAFMDGANMAEVARQAGVSREMIRQLVDGKSGPGIEVALKLERVSYGKVPVASWIRAAKGSKAA
jgi:plasmid maintenance system antidote protein VapI